MMMATSMARRPKRASLDHGEEGIDSADRVELDTVSVEGETKLAFNMYWYGNGGLTGR